MHDRFGITAPDLKLYLRLCKQKLQLMDGMDSGALAALHFGRLSPAELTPTFRPPVRYEWRSAAHALPDAVRVMPRVLVTNASTTALVWSFVPVDSSPKQ